MRKAFNVDCNLCRQSAVNRKMPVASVTEMATVTGSLTAVRRFTSRPPQSGGGRREVADIEHRPQRRRVLFRVGSIFVLSANVRGYDRSSGVASILPFIKLEDGSFDHELTRNMLTYRFY